MSEAHSGSKPVSGAERRAFIRYMPATDLPSHVVLEAVKKRWPATVRDISKAGIGLTFSRPIEAGTLGEVELQCPNSSLCYTFRVRIAFSTEQSDGSWRIGAAFVQELSDDELRSLL